MDWNVKIANVTIVTHQLSTRGGVPAKHNSKHKQFYSVEFTSWISCSLFLVSTKMQKKSWFLALKDGGQYPETALQIFLLWRFRGTTYSRLGLPWMKLLRFNRVGYFPKDCSSIIERRGNLRCKVIWDISGSISIALTYFDLSSEFFHLVKKNLPQTSPNGLT